MPARFAPIAKLFERHGLCLNHVQPLTIHGGSLTTVAGLVTGDANADRVYFLGLPAGGASSIYTVDTITGAEQIYFNPLKTLAPAVTDIEAFSCSTE